MKFLIINGPNMNMLGVREPEIYGHKTLKDLEAVIWAYCSDKGVDLEFFQSNSEGAIVDAIQEALKDDDGIIINPAAYTHTSIAIPDAIKAVGLPAVEVHLSDLNSRESYRKHSFTSEACIATIMGKGFDGYLEAVDTLLQALK
ncbi:MAG: type II 3-dehydroquinate dehydratase [Eubacteriales bacterium]|nr:type II 3-dehydroquinate dehydratase [Eubacteriales bacterium]